VVAVTVAGVAGGATVDGVHRLVDQHRVPVEWVGLSGDEHSVEEGQGNVGQFVGDGGDEFLLLLSCVLLIGVFGPLTMRRYRVKN
jgi:hypothetical protein